MWSSFSEKLIQLSEPILHSLSQTDHNPPQHTNFNSKTLLLSLLPNPNPNSTSTSLRHSIRDFVLALALISSSDSSSHDSLSWIPHHLRSAAASAFSDLARAYCSTELVEGRSGEVLSDEKWLVIELVPEVLPVLKERIKESSIDKSGDGDEISAASERAPVGSAVVAACQFRWFVTQIDYPHLGKFCGLVIPCGLTALDHWSPEVKEQGMISFIHLAKNVDTNDISLFEDVILDACCQNIASADEIWHLIVEMSVLLVSFIQQNNPRSPWFERILSEMLSHLERQPRNKDRRIAWLTFIEPIFHGIGLVLLAHFRRIFPLFFQWMHADDNETVLLVLKRIAVIVRLTWIRNTPYIGRLVDELVALYKEAALRTAREEIRTSIIGILVLLQKCKGEQFEAAWNKHRNDPNLKALPILECGDDSKKVAPREEQLISNLKQTNALSQN